MRTLLSELHIFKQTRLYKHFVAHFETLYSLTIEQILALDLKGPETLYTREAWIGEARTAQLMAPWFEDLTDELLSQMREIDNTPNDNE